MAKQQAAKSPPGAPAAAAAARSAAQRQEHRDGESDGSREGDGLRGSDLFTGRDSLRVAGEGRALWLCALAAPLTIALVGAFLESVTFSGFVLLIVAGMVFVSVGRGRLLGSSIRIDGRQMPEIQELVHTLAARLRIAPPQIFVRDDLFLATTAVGIGEPYALVLSSQYVDHLRRGELGFLIARELAHIAAGHTRLASLLSASGRENPVVALVFGAWLRRTEYTADRVGLLCCDGLEEALGGISIATFHAIGRRVDMEALAEQRRELDAEPTLRIGEWSAAIPYATNRLSALRDFAASPLAATWRAKLDGLRAQPPVARQAPASSTVRRRDCAGFWRRSVALAIDLIIIAAILKTGAGAAVTESAKGVSAAHATPILKAVMQHLPLVQAGTAVLVSLFVYFFYSAVLVGVAGQTLGMLIFELRVVTTRFAHPSLGQSAWRSVLGLGSALTAAALLGCFFRIQPHDRLSGTRVVQGRRTA
ncbi:MAG: RDD family protein [Candidatus Eremiobacteraeota bacterium]|nr:RDD family protein [Candidatus Eremiobacteraeota bacterium]MBC5801760.1 RDD family protein [Candidatus Eremiobacteraeota bacterium]MBC5820848.1 RDD family protein [Candidatus Eremiobacteraeota bacterium]